MKFMFKVNMKGVNPFGLMLVLKKRPAIGRILLQEFQRQGFMEVIP